MDDYSILIKLQKVENELHFLSYSGDFNSCVENEIDFCHSFKASFETQNILNEFDISNFVNNTCVEIDMQNKNIHFFNEWDGNEYTLNFKQIEENKNNAEIILTEKIKHLKELYEVEYKNSVNSRKKLNEIEKLLIKEIDLCDRKSDFFENEKNLEKSAYIKGKLDMGRIILNKINN